MKADIIEKLSIERVWKFSNTGVKQEKKLVQEMDQTCTSQIKQRNAYFKKYVTNLKILVEFIL